MKAKEEMPLIRSEAKGSEWKDACLNYQYSCAIFMVF